ncbi:plasmid mobilization protein [Sphingobacterium yanglingense]|uniref:Mobilization protein MobC n=1 Tax=Sphingobacterium yanglingense TaxID=1437280 RepID=A0A4R6W8W7_9SPHI|nr:plasmid mobilization relaxosome protein MobC [Sphingobacterium yanglingense]TDQ73842.1 hypothetical protein CLV99_4279 [Sphingobacterium yanglingense]
MKKEVKNKNKWLHIRIDEDELLQLQNMQLRTTEKYISNYVRKIMFNKPLIARTRDESLNEIITVLTKLQKDLNGIGNNYNQMLHRLHLSTSVAEVKLWLKLYEKQRVELFICIDEIKAFIAKSAEKWLQE